MEGNFPHIIESNDQPEQQGQDGEQGQNAPVFLPRLMRVFLQDAPPQDEEDGMEAAQQAEEQNAPPQPLVRRYQDHNEAAEVLREENGRMILVCRRTVSYVTEERHTIPEDMRGEFEEPGNQIGHNINPNPVVLEVPQGNAGRNPEIHPENQIEHDMNPNLLVLEVPQDNAGRNPEIHPENQIEHDMNPNPPFVEAPQGNVERNPEIQYGEGDFYTENNIPPIAGSSHYVCNYGTQNIVSTNRNVPDLLPFRGANEHNFCMCNQASGIQNPSSRGAAAGIHHQNVVANPNPPVFRAAGENICRCNHASGNETPSITGVSAGIHHQNQNVVENPNPSVFRAAAANFVRDNPIPSHHTHSSRGTAVGTLNQNVVANANPPVCRFAPGNFYMRNLNPSLGAAGFAFNRNQNVVGNANIPVGGAAPTDTEYSSCTRNQENMSHEECVDPLADADLCNRTPRFTYNVALDMTVHRDARMIANRNDPGVSGYVGNSTNAIGPSTNASGSVQGQGTNVDIHARDSEHSGGLSALEPYVQPANVIILDTLSMENNTSDRSSLSNRSSPQNVGERRGPQRQSARRGSRRHSHDQVRRSILRARKKNSSKQFDGSRRAKGK